VSHDRIGDLRNGWCMCKACIDHALALQQGIAQIQIRLLSLESGGSGGATLGSHCAHARLLHVWNGTGSCQMTVGSKSLQ
jgi:hypothetical protein